MRSSTARSLIRVAVTLAAAALVVTACSNPTGPASIRADIGDVLNPPDLGCLSAQFAQFSCIP